MDIICPKGHHSTDPDFCSECGAKIDATDSAITASIGSTTVPTATIQSDSNVCPDCGTPRTNMAAIFCEVCRYNFSTHQSWTTPSVTAAPAPPPDVGLAPGPDPVAAAPLSTPAPVIASGEFIGWDAVLSIDGSLYTDPDPNLPLPNEPERTYPLDLAESLIGRRSDRRDIHPEINVNDSGVSHRHAKLLREQDGTISLLDLGSTNGTRLNGTDVAGGVRTPVTDGDQVTLGYWTRIVIRGRRS
ncbi:MAG: FHA domain-containing protein [Capsulimonadaceae bacterium]